MRSKGHIFLFSVLAGLATLYLWNMSTAQVPTDADSIPEVCLWRMLGLPEWPLQQTVVNETVNAPLLLYLGLMNASLNEEFIGRNFTWENCTYPSDGNTVDYATNFTIVKDVVKNVTSNSTLFCEVLHTFDPATKGCYALESQEKQFTLPIESSTELLRCFDPRSPDIPQVRTNGWINKAIQSKKIALGNKVCVSVPHGSILFQDETFLLRFFFLVKPGQSIAALPFKSHLVISEKTKRMYLTEDLCLALGFQNACNQYDIQIHAARWLTEYLHIANSALSLASFESIDQVREHYHLMSADYYFGATFDDFHLLRIHGELPGSRRNANANYSDVSSLLDYQLIASAMRFLLRPSALVHSNNGVILDALTPAERNELNVISAISLQPASPLFPRFQPVWTSYTLHLPYESIVLGVKIELSLASAGAILFDDKHVAVGNDWHNVSVGVGWNSFEIRVVHAKRSMKAITYKFDVFRSARESEPAKDELVTCQLEQDCSVRFKGNGTACGLVRSAPFDSWNAALDAWNKLAPCGKTGDASGAWMVPCSAGGAGQWRRARWQPFACRYVPISTSQLQTCLADRQLIFVGDSTNRGVMESIAERLDASLTPADRIKWHAYRYRPANGTHLHFDYYPKYWLKRPPSLEQTLVETIRRATGGGGGATVAALVVGGFDWPSASHVDAIRRVVDAEREALRGAEVVLKMPGYGVSSADRVTPGDFVSKTGRLQRLALAARDRAFLTLDAWNMTAARFRDFSPGRCRCHFHQIVRDGRGRLVSAGDVNRALVDILVHHLCANAASN